MLAAAALVVATATPASADPTGYFIWDSDPDAWPTAGHSGTWYQPDLFSVHEFPEKRNQIRIYGETPGGGQDYLSIELWRNDGQRIGEGHYTDQPVRVVYWSYGWVDEGADFDVEHIAYDADGRIREFDGAVEHHYRDQPDTTFRAKISYRR
ncbi:hypothetical protein UK23_26095 [Lentzea aerocolonigenes]|uniref:Uncharacterized protein n=1 Tax=Lentzea aerocolonigenes TaxID=68170 RepID=A0A0F0GQ95_LENAE|nr:hypothetical protein UK23_26095 [Lentzea aerocolonigenes]